jgi:uncharacterized protein (DUF305 family)
VLSFGGASADSAVAGRAGRAEVRFMEGMIDHHQMALDMAADCLKKAETADVKKLCQAIIDAQTPEIKQMQDWLKNWYKVDYQPMPMEKMQQGMAGGHDGHSGHDMGGMKTDPAGMMGMFAGLNQLKGRDYEIAWLESMIDHHDDAIHMSNRILKSAQHADLKTLAEKIIKDQTAEIQMMEALITTLSKPA